MAKSGLVSLVGAILGAGIGIGFVQGATDLDFRYHNNDEKYVRDSFPGMACGTMFAGVAGFAFGGLYARSKYRSYLEKEAIKEFRASGYTRPRVEGSGGPPGFSSDDYGKISDEEKANLLKEDPRYSPELAEIERKLSEENPSPPQSIYDPDEDTNNKP